MKNFITFLLILISGIIFASLFGILHDQITYTLSSEYYTKFKFQQFGLDYFYSNTRYGVVFVGILATWWVGIPFGFLFGIILATGKRTSNQVQILLKTYLHVAIMTLLIGFIGLLYSLLFIGQHDYWHYWIPDTISNKRMFLAVGLMHNFSYFGGIVGLIYGLIKIIRFKRKLTNKILGTTNRNKV